MPLSTHALCTTDLATLHLARLAGVSNSLLVEVREEKCFHPDTWLPLGEVRLYPPEAADSKETNEDRLCRSIQHGQFAWRTPTADVLTDDLTKVIEGADAAKQAVLEALQDIARRLLLILPTFDPAVAETLPFQRPTTIVVDTSSVIQGALDFVVCFLYPMARIKVPAVVSLEILNMADRFLAMRRASRLRRVRCLEEHLKSQGAQRALLRLEWRSDAQVERPIQATDPLRIIFDRDTEGEINDLNLSKVQRSFADRLIFESAREHLSLLSPNHGLCVLTSDQGLARMALSEGIQPIYFEARKHASPLGRTLTGTLFDPFQPRVYTVSLKDVLWELATCFGDARLRTADGAAEFQATAIGDLTWYPYHSKDDLLWCRWTDTLASVSQLEPAFPARSVVAPYEAEPRAPTQESAIETSQPTGSATATRMTQERVGGYVVSPSALLRLVRDLAILGRLSDTEAIATLAVSSRETYREYRGFLTSGGFVARTEGGLVKLDPLDTLWASLRDLDLPQLQQCLTSVPSFQGFLRFVEEHGDNPNWQGECPMRLRTLHGYKALAEVSAAAMAVPGQGIYRTPRRPSTAEFVPIALHSYAELSRADPWVLTGQWLEELARVSRIHPVTTRACLDAAYNEGLMNRYFEGSTPERRFDTHTLDVLELVESAPTIQRYHLYRGDFLVPGRASVRIRLEGRPQ